MDPMNSVWLMPCAGAAEVMAKEKRLAKRVTVLLPSLLLLMHTVPLPMLLFMAIGGDMYCSNVTEFSGSKKFEKTELNYTQN